MNLTPIRVAIIGVDKFTAPLRLFNSQVRTTLKPLSDLSEHVGRFTKAAGFERLGSAMAGVGSSVGAVFSSVGGLAMKLGAVGAGAGAGLYAIVNGSAQAGNNLKKLAYEIGMPIGPLQQLQYVAGKTGVDSELFGKSMLKFGKNAAEAAARTGEAYPAFRAIGVNVKDAGGKIRPIKDILLNVAAAMNKLPDPLMRNRVAVALFGKSGFEMTKMLKGGREELEKTMAKASKFGLFTDDAADKSEKFTEAQKDAAAALTGIRNVVGIQLMPIFTTWMKKLSDLIVVYRPQIQAFAKKFAEGMPERIGKLIDAGKKLWERLQPILDVLKGVVHILGPANTALLLLAGTVLVTVVPSIYGLVTAVGALGAVLLTTPIGWIALAIAGLGAAVFATYMHYRNLKSLVQGPVKISTVEEAKKESVKDLRDKYFRSLRSSGTVEATPEIAEAEEKVKSYGVGLPEDTESKVKFINDLYNQDESRCRARREGEVDPGLRSCCRRRASRPAISRRGRSAGEFPGRPQYQI